MRIALMKDGKEFENIAVKSEFFVALSNIRFFNHNNMDYEIVDRKLNLGNSTLYIWVRKI